MDRQRLGLRVGPMAVLAVAAQGNSSNHLYAGSLCELSGLQQVGPSISLMPNRIYPNYYEVIEWSLPSLRPFHTAPAFLIVFPATSIIAPPPSNKNHELLTSLTRIKKLIPIYPSFKITYEANHFSKQTATDFH